MAENRRRQATVIGFALLGAGGLMLLHNSSPAAKPPAPPPPPPAPPPAPPPGVSSGGVPVVPAPAPRYAAAARVVLVRPTYYLVRNLNGSTRLRTTSKAQALAAAIATRAAGVSVWIEGGQAIYVVPGAIGRRNTAPRPPAAPKYRPPTASTEGRSGPKYL